MALNMKTLTQALAKTAAVIEKTVQTTVQEVTGPKPLQDYDLLDQVGSGGPGLAWRLYSAKPRAAAPAGQYPLVCVWVLDKRALSEARARAGLTKAAEDAFLEVVRADAARLVRLRHPGVVHVVQALDETKTAMAMVTEPLFASVANVLGAVENVAKVPKELKGVEMGLLEVKHGLLQLAETLDFLHNNAHLVHRSISPETVFITASGAWKLGGFGFATSADSASSDSNAMQPFHFSEYDVEDSMLPLQPSLDYTAPELVRSKASGASSASDIFSFACLAYHLVARKPLLECHSNVKMYMNRLSYLSQEVFTDIPSELVADLQKMLSMDESSRPTAMGFTGSPFFRDDTRLRALRFLDHMLERDNMQKTEFLKALADMWKDFDSRVLRYKVLSPLCAELRNMVMQPMILPMVLTIAESQDKNDFEISTLPALVPVLSSAAGETLLLLLKHAELLISKTSHDQLISCVLPLLVRAYNDTDVRIQEEVLRRTVTLAKQLDTQLVKQAILPRVHGLALKTTVAAVRVNALLCLGDLVHSLDKHAVLGILETLQRCTAVDRSAPTLMCTLGVAHSILKQYGVEFTTEHVLPLLFPLLIASQLNVQQFAKYMLFVKDILRKIEEKRGVTLTDSGTPEIKIVPSVANGMHSESQGTSIPSAVKKSTSWDEDWGPPVRTQLTTRQPLDSSLSKQSNYVSQPSTSISSLTSSSSQPPMPMQQNFSSCPAVDIEWPPRKTSSGKTSSGLEMNSDTVNTNFKGMPETSFDDLDPFANWPPQPSNSYGSMSSSSSVTSSTPNIGNSVLTGLGQSGMSFASTPPIGQTKQGMSSMSNIGGFNHVSLSGNGSIGFLKANQVDAGMNIGSSFNSDKRASDLGSIFSTSKNEHSMPKLAPPPPNAIGRGRGRTSLSAASRSSQVKGPSELPPILDLL